METLKFDLTKKVGGFKPMNAVNNGPVFKRHCDDQPVNNLDAYKAANIPFARNHDASFYANYGGEHIVDISAIFPNFDADPYSSESYDFACTDEYVAVTELAGTKTFYRLGQKVEHYIKKFDTLPPKDFKKWAVICEHIIRHYNEGWANGYELNLEYWEIWNEADIDPDDSPNKRSWGGTKAQFFDFYEIAAKHLKECFPHLKIGGPALAYSAEWAEEFLQEMKKRNVPIDFFSWHVYCTDPKLVAKIGEFIYDMLVRNGYENSERILNEWNYVKNFEDKWLESLKVEKSMKGAAYTMAVMSEGQKSCIDMLMYYDARPCGMNGMFDTLTLEPLKGYYPFLWFGKLYGLSEVRCEDEPDKLYTLCGVDENDKVTAIVTYYSDDCLLPDKTVKLDFGKSGRYEIYVLDEDKSNELAGESVSLEICMKPNSCIFVKEI